MTTDVNVCNMALALLGDERISALDEDSEAARACNAIYTMTRDGLLRAHPWNFAMARAQLPALVAAPAFGWTNAFTLPTDPYCLRVMEVVDYKQDDWVVEGRQILSNYAPLKIRFVKRVTDPAEFDPLFAMALASRVAVQIAVRLTGSTGAKKDAESEYRRSLQEARSADGQEGMVESINAETLTDARL